MGDARTDPKNKKYDNENITLRLQEFSRQQRV